VRLRFLGTRGEIEARTRRHRRHSSLLVGYRRRDVMIDCGLDWRDELGRLRPGAIVLTHAHHPGHAAGLRDGAPCPVYATEETWSAIERHPIAERGMLEEGHATVWLEGKKVRGGYALTRIGKGTNERWLLVKMDDEGADRRRKPVSSQPEWC
jgi:glyoxylase-like metal-dependent hydrolase (beta-lactamase superfamily II)